MKKGLPLALALLAVGLLAGWLLLSGGDPEGGEGGRSQEDVAVGGDPGQGAGTGDPSPGDRRPAGTGDGASPEATGPLLSGVVRTDGQQSIAEAVVTLHDLDRGLPVLHLTQTDFGGHYAITAREAGDLSGLTPGVAAAAPGRARVVHPLPPLPPGVSLTEDFTLPPQEPFAGRVIWEGDGAPVANADLFAHTGLQALDAFTFSSGRADGLGEFRLEHLRSERNQVTLEVRPEGETIFRSAGAQGHGEDLTIMLSRGTARVVGRVVQHSDGAPAPEVPVWIGNAANGPDAFLTTADAEGRFAFEGIPLGQWTARVPTHPDDSVSFMLGTANEERSITIRLGAAVPFTGQAIDLDTGEPVPSLRLRARDSGHTWVPSVTDGEGRFVIRGLSGLEGETMTTPDRSLTIALGGADWFFPSGERQAEFRVTMRGADPVPIQLGVHRGVPMTLRAIDLRDQPTPDVEVALLTPQSTFDSGPTEIGRTGPDGTLVVPVPRVPSPLQFIGMGQSAPFLSEPTETTAEEAILRELALLPVEVHVTDAAERVVAGANVTIAMEFPVVSIELRGEMQDTRQTDELGVATFGDTPASPVKVTAIARPVANTTPPAVTARFDLTNETPPVRIDVQFDEVLRYPIAGRVIDAISEAPIADATVNWSTRDVHGTIREGNAVTTSEEGGFEVITDADQIWLDLQVVADGYETRETEHWLLDLPEPEIRLSPLPRLVGRVAPTADPAQTLFTLWNLEEFEETPLWTLKEVRTGEGVMDAADGFFEWQVSSRSIAESNRLMVFAPTERVGTLAFGREESADGTLFYLGDLDLLAGHPAEGLVVERGGGAPIESATVIFERHRQDLMEGRGEPALQAVTGAAGGFALGPLPPGPWRLRAGAEGYKPALEEIELPLEGDVVIELEPLVGSALTLDITAPEGGPLTSASVRVWDPSGGLDPDDMDPLTWRDEAPVIQGQVRFEDIPLTSVLVEITRTGGAPRFGHRFSQPLTSEDHREQIDLSLWEEVSGTILRGFTPVADAFVRWETFPETEARRTWGEAAADSLGRYLLRLPEGEYHVEANGVVLANDSGVAVERSVPASSYSLIYTTGL